MLPVGAVRKVCHSEDRRGVHEKSDKVTQGAAVVQRKK